MQSVTARAFDADLVRSYDVSGPRYTSYPSANLFSDEFDKASYPRRLRALAPGAPLSVYVHVPFCDTICYYCACNKIVTNNRRHAVEYLERLFREAEMVGSLLPEHEVEQLHFGGGTPTYLDDAQLEAVFGVLNRHFHIATGPRADLSIEIDPRTVTPERIEVLTRLGINRMSLGIQDFDPDVQMAVNRLQSEADTCGVIRAARNQGVSSVSVDLIYGLPRQRPEGFRRTIERIAGLAPDRVSLYNYAHLPHRFKTQKQIRAEELPSPETKLELLRIAVDALTGAGYAYVGMDHFALPGDDLVRAQHNGTLHRSFQGYTTHGYCDLVGLGVSAISSVGGLYCQNAKTLPAYYAAIDAGVLATERGIELTAEDEIVADLIETLMCHFRLDIADFEAQHGVDFHRRFGAEIARLAPMVRDGLLELSEGRIEVTERGRFLIRNICMVFDQYLDPAAQLFSRTV